MCGMLKWIVWGEGGLSSPGILTLVRCTSVWDGSGGDASGCFFLALCRKELTAFPEQADL